MTHALARTLILLAACGGDGGSLADARFGGADAPAADAARPDAAPPLGWLPAIAPDDSPAWVEGAMAADTLQGNLVYFGGRTGFGPSVGTTAATWTWESGVWTRRNPSTSPPPRDSHCLAFDGIGVVLFGGNDGVVLYGDTWRWDGTTWTELAVAGPPARILATCGWDPTRNEVLLFGGSGVAGALSDTWRWNGVGWAELAPATTPTSNLAGGTLTPAPGGTMLMVGEGTPSTWVWDGTDWNQRVPVSSPPGGLAQCSYADPTTGEAVVLGGRDGPSQYMQTWAWDGTAWAQRTAQVLPNERTHHRCAVIPGSTDVLLQGGTWRDGQATSLRWDQIAWSESELPPGPGFNSAAGAVYDSARGDWLRVNLNDNSTWMRNASAQWRRAAGGSPPGGNAQPQLAFDVVRGKALLYGAGAAGQDTWTWDGATWTAETPATSPGVTAAAIAWHAGTGRVILFGGNDGVAVSAATWTWSGATWELAAPTGSPPARSAARMALDPSRDRVVLWGGADGSPLGDVWEFDGTTWTERVPATTVLDTSVESVLVEAPDRQGVIAVLREDPSAAGSMGLYRWDGSDWTSVVGPGTPPPARGGFVAATDTTRGELLIYGGNLATTNRFVREYAVWKTP